MFNGAVKSRATSAPEQFLAMTVPGTGRVRLKRGRGGRQAGDEIWHAPGQESAGKRIPQPPQARVDHEVRHHRTEVGAEQQALRGSRAMQV